LQDRKTGQIFVAEMKCEIAFERFKYLTLTGPRLLDHHKKEAFAAFLNYARGPSTAIVGGSQIATDGAILIWGDATSDGVASVQHEFGFHDVLSVTHIIAELRAWQSPEWQALVSEVQNWTAELGSWLEYGLSESAV
jgi:hypothetical protein